MRVLVTAASRHDATREIADAIVSGLAHRGVDAEARPVEQAGTLDDFDAVIAGSAIYMGRWLKAAREFVSDHAAELSSMPVLKAVHAPEGDCRDWDAIDAFAGEIASQLAADGAAN